MLFAGSIILQAERELHSVNTLKHNKDISFISIVLWMLRRNKNSCVLNIVPLWNAHLYK